MELAQFTLCPFSFVSLESFSKDRALSPPSTVQKLSLLHLIYNNLLEQYLCITYKIKLILTKIMMNLVLCFLPLHCIYGKGTHIPFRELNFLDLLTVGNIFKI